MEGYIFLTHYCNARCPFCVHPDMEVLTLDGFKKVGELTIGDKVLGLNQINTVTAVVKHWYKGELIKIKPYYLPEIWLTANHRVYVLRGSKIVKVPASEIRENDYLIIEIPTDIKDISEVNIEEKIPFYAKYTLCRNPETLGFSQAETAILFAIAENRYGAGKCRSLRWRGLLRKTKLPEHELKTSLDSLIEKGFVKSYTTSPQYPLYTLSKKFIYTFGSRIKWNIKTIKINDNILRLLGYYLAEGNISGRSTPSRQHHPLSKVCFTFSLSEQKYVDDILNITQHEFGLKTTVGINRVNKTYQLAINSKPLARYIHYNFDHLSYKKKIPAEFLLLPPKKQVQILCGLFRGDGFLKPVKTPRRKYVKTFAFVTTSPALAGAVMIMLMRLGIIVNFRKRPPVGKAKHNNYMFQTNQEQELSK